MKSVIVFNAKGGLGNQLFIAAAAMSLSKNLNCRTYVSMINIDRAHQDSGSDIRRLNFQKRLFTSAHPLLYLFVRILNIGNQKSWLRIFADRFKVKVEDQLDQGSNLESLNHFLKKYPKNRVLMVEGYFQDFSYADELKLNQDKIFNNANLKLNKLDSYCVVHVRLGDMLRYKSSFGVLSERYYRNAINTAKENSKSEIQLVSDDFDSALLMLPELSSNFDRSLAIKESKDPLLGFYRILEATGIIVSNSTYSYWAAFLSKKAEFVVAPSQMSVDQRTQIINLPPSWILISPDWENF